MLKKISAFGLLCFLSTNVIASNVVIDGSSDFLSLCKLTIKDANKDVFCSGVNDVLFKNNSKDIISYVTPAQIGVTSLPLDSKIDYIAFNDPNALNGVAYCYFVYKNWISMSKISPDLLGTSATGFSILKEDLKSYQEWLNTSNIASECKGLVQKESEVTVSNLESYLKDKIAIIGINPYAIIQTPNIDLNKVVEDIRITVNHERIHAYQASCPELEKWSLDQWKALPVKEKNQYINKHPTYTWSIPKVAGREYIGYKYENNFSEIEARLKSCPFK